MPRKTERDLQAVVGREAYAVWVDMLREIVPDGRTHRLSVVIAAMRHYALNKSNRIGHRTETRHSVAMSLIKAADAGDPDLIRERIHDVVDRLFRDAGVSYERISRRGEHYSIANETYPEFASWFDYPWD